ncbi:hypothetical protein J5Y04_32575 [Kitasatospora sp. RG8]|uniref:hypothetical protein n=1 Tax=Kitasatospora sp. RG8 TaxID=2820815 RepID=UPI001AE010C0|nr:hypothetical protein [Kitasatospora sp. RG8]MBP0454234.1 hypothetical protein [Kitasatospora sp. RG8]
MPCPPVAPIPLLPGADRLRIDRVGVNRVSARLAGEEFEPRGRIETEAARLRRRLKNE